MGQQGLAHKLLLARPNQIFENNEVFFKQFSKQNMEKIVSKTDPLRFLLITVPPLKAVFKM